MFFRFAKEHEVTQFDFKSCCIIEDQTGIQGLFFIQNNKITIIEIDKNNYFKIIEYIEEYLFMKYSLIKIINPDFSLDYNQHQWIIDNQIVKKEKSTGRYFQMLTCAKES